MERKTMGTIIAARRKELGMTQKELADAMQVTDKAVSKWERNLSCPDIGSIPLLARTLEMSVEELMDVSPAKDAEAVRADMLVDSVLKSLALAMGVALTVLSVMGKAELNAAMGMTGIGLTAMALRQFLTR